MPLNDRNITKDEADVIVTAMIGATDTQTQRDSSEAMAWVLMFHDNVEVMVDAKTPYAIVKALIEWEDRIAIYNIASGLRILAPFYTEDGKVQLFELLVPKIRVGDGIVDHTDYKLFCVLSDLAKKDALARQRLRDIPDVMQKLDACEPLVKENQYFMKFLNRMRSLSPSGTMTKAAR